MRSRYPRIILEDFETSVEIIGEALKDPLYVSAANCPYTPLLQDGIVKAVRSLRELNSETKDRAINNVKLTATGDRPEDMLMWQIDNAISDIRSVISNQSSSEASKVSASKFLFELLQKRVEISERLANIDRVFSLEALLKEFIEHHSESSEVAKDFIKRLEDLGSKSK